MKFMRKLKSVFKIFKQESFVTTGKNGYLGKKVI